eukprot:bmy_19319T0
MSQPGQKPAASPRPRRAAASRHTQEPCAKLGGAGSTRQGRADVGPAQVPPPLTAVGLEKLSASQVWGRWSASPAPAVLHPVSSPGSPPRDSEQIGCRHGIRKLVVHDGKLERSCLGRTGNGMGFAFLGVQARGMLLDVHSPAQRRGSQDWGQGENPKLRGAEATEIKTLVENERERGRERQRERESPLPYPLITQYRLLSTVDKLLTRTSGMPMEKPVDRLQSQEKREDQMRKKRQSSGAVNPPELRLVEQLRSPRLKGLGIIIT